MLFRSVRDQRGDREKSAMALIEERQEVMRQYQESLEAHRRRFHTAGVDGEDLVLLSPERASPLQQLRWWWDDVVRRRDPMDALVKDYPLLQVDANLWDMERKGLLRRAAGLSVEMHKKFALPVACIVFVLIGAPIGMRVKRAGPAVAFLSIGFFLFYYVCLIGGEELHNNHHAFPASARHGLQWWQFDVSWIAIRTLGYVGLVRKIRLPGPERMQAKRIASA